MQKAIEAIIARIHGEFDNTALLSYGALSDLESDILRIAESAQTPDKPIIGVYMHQGTVQWTAANVPGVTVVLMDEDKESEEVASLVFDIPDHILTGKLSERFANAREGEWESDKEVRLSFHEQLLANNL